MLVVATYWSCDEEFTNFVAEVEEAIVVERQTPRLREVTETNEEDQKKKALTESSKTATEKTTL